MKKFILFFFCLIISTTLFAKQRLDLAIVTDGKYVTDLKFQKKIEDEISKLLKNDYSVHYKLFQSKRSDYLSIATQVNLALNDKKMDIIIPIGPLSSHYASRKNRYFRPLIAVNILDHAVQKIPYKNGKSAKKNFTYFQRFLGTKEDVQEIKKIEPVKSVAILAQQSLIKNSPLVKRNLKKSFKEAGIEAKVFGVDKDFEKELSQLEGKFDLVYVTPLLFLSKQERKNLYSILRQKELHSYSALGATDVKLGALYAVAPEENIERLARYIALSIQQIKSGFNASKLPVALDIRKKLVINMATADEVNFSPSWDMLSSAELVEEQKSDSHYFSIEDIITRALDYNLNLKSIQYTQKLKELNTDVLSAALLPQIHLTAAAQQIDVDRADASLGTLDETSAFVGANFSQSIYTQTFTAKVDAQKFVVEAASKEVKFIEQDVSLAAALLYLKILQLQDEMKINKQNFSLSQENLRSANIRQSLGSGSNGEIYRWESKIATDKQAVIATHAEIQSSRVQLNALLDLQQNIPLNFKSIDQTNPIFIISRKEIVPYMTDSRRFKLFQDFLVQEAIENAPELDKYKMLVQARKRLVDSNKDAFYTPDIVLKADLNYQLMSKNSSIATQLPEEIQNLPKADDLSWSMGFFADFPLYVGDALEARYESSQVAMLATKAAEAQQKNDIEHRVRDALFKAKASFLLTELSQKSYNAARKNYELMKSIYAEGGTNIIHLLDAQNAMLKAALMQNRTKYKFLLDVLRTQRSIGRVNFNISDEAFGEWFARLQEFEQKNR